MPQPLRQPCEINLTGLAGLTEHAGILGSIVAVSALIETYLGWVLAFLTRGSANVAIPMFKAVSSIEAQRAMLTAAAEAALTGEELEAFRNLMTEFRTRYTERNKLVHGVWGTSPAHPGKALLVSPAKLGAIMMAAASVEADDQATVARAVEHTRSLYKGCLAYTQRDLLNVFERLRHHHGEVQAFAIKIRGAHPLWSAGEASDERGTPPLRL